MIVARQLNTIQLAITELRKMKEEEIKRLNKNEIPNSYRP